MLAVNEYMDWGVKEVADFLSQNDVDSEVIEAFKDHKIRGKVLPSLTCESLQRMGIRKEGPSLEILNLFKRVSKGAAIAQPFAGMADQFKVFNDPIHGHLELHPLCVAIIDTPQFQRLRYIRQTGGCYYVFPGATHNRFEHSIGVCYLAGQLCQALRSRQPELNITDQDILCVKIAGLCHDLGHGPFSHMFDLSFIPKARPNYNWKHEMASKMMFDHLVKVNNLEQKFQQYGLGEKDRTFITEQITASLKKNSKGWQYVGRDKDKSYLYEIVANERNGIDVDKWDYFARDCHCLGIKNNFDHMRFIQFARVINVTGEWQICSRDKEVGNLYDMFHTRNTLHRRAYQHKTSFIVEYMVTEALLLADPYLLIETPNGEKVRMSEAIDNPEAYTKLTDHVYHMILMSMDKDLRPATELLKRIESRDLYKCIGQGKPKKIFKLDMANEESMRDDIVCESGGKLSKDDIFLQCVELDYGKKEKNPIDNVRFYKKDDPTKAIRIHKYQVSHMLPMNFREQLLRVFVKKTDAASKEVATRCFKEWCQKVDMEPLIGEDVGPTPNGSVSE